MLNYTSKNPAVILRRPVPDPGAGAPRARCSLGEPNIFKKLNMLNRSELVLTVIAGVLALLLRRNAFPRLALRAFNRVANRPGLAVTLAGLLGFGGSAIGAIFGSWPEPRTHDEFCHLLAGDTYAAGRLANPAHPLGVFFESHHINQIPTYGSKYPPAQGWFLGLGQVLGGQPVVGVWISFGLACAALCWMLQAWVPPRWALGGALLAAVRLGFLGSWAGTQGYWTQSYWGGAVAMLGGALAFGALRRLGRPPQVGHAGVLGAGLGLLANSRPFEGLIASLPVFFVLAAYLVGRLPPPQGFHRGRVLLALVGVLGFTVAGMAYNNRQTTGHPLRFPYQVHDARYSVSPLFLWQPLEPEPAYNHEVIRVFQARWSRDYYLQRRTLDGYARDVAARCSIFIGFFCGIALLPALLALPWVVRDRWMAFAAATCGLVFAGLLVTTAYQPHYLAPLGGLVFALLIRGLRHVRLWHWRVRALGRAYVRALPLAYLLLVPLAVAEMGRVDEDAWHRQRARLLRQLEQDGDRHLVLVRYAADHSTLEEWVYNRADLDAAKVLWAHDMGPERNRALLEYFRGRRIWLLEADAPVRRLLPYAGP